jgi:hypothetical protein
MKVKKKNLLVERTEPLLIHQAPNEKHNEVTVAMITYALPLANITECISPQMLRKIKKVEAGFPDAGIKLMFLDRNPSYVFTCKGKTERRGDDSHNQELADRIAISKCRAKACNISIRIIKAIGKALVENVQHCDSLVGILQSYYAREASYIKKV